jgi:hypothetical protein
MADQLNPVATHHLPAFITAPGETDVLMVATAIMLGLSVFAFGLIFFRLHTLPERVAHKGQKIQFEIVAILGLLALFTHMHIFWVIGLVLAFIDIPDFGGIFGRIAGSVERMAGLKPGMGAADVPEPGATMSSAKPVPAVDPRDGREPSAGKKPVGAVANRRAVDHA